MHTSIKTFVIAVFIASAIAVPARAGTGVPALGGSGGGSLLMLPIACSVVLPFIKSAKLRRQLTHKEISATTLMCFTGPLGYHIATKEGWIGPNFFRHRHRK